MGKTAAETADNSGPLDKRLVSKNWSVRANAYDELKGLCEKAVLDSKDPIFAENVDNWKAYLKDTNPGALEKALDCLVIFLQKVQAKTLMDSQNGIIGIIIEKMLLTHAKPGIRAKSMDSFLSMFEVTANFEDSIDTI